MELHDAEEAIGMRRILTHDMRMKRNSQTMEDTFWTFTDFHRVMRAQLAPPYGHFINCRHKPRNLLYPATFSNTL